MTTISGRRKGPLPEAGDERREELRRRKDDLDEQGEQLAAQHDIERVDPKKIKPDREILGVITSAFNPLKVSHSQVEYVYCWARPGGANDQVINKTSIAVPDEDGNPVQCWEVVMGDMPEAIERRDALGYRRVGDVILLRCRRDRYRMLERDHIRKTRLRGASIGQELEELADKTQGLVTVHRDVSDPKLQRYLKHTQAAGMATDQTDARLRSGQMPGAEMRS